MKHSRIAGLLIPLLAPLVLLALIAKHGVNVPFWDEWTIQGPFFMQESHSAADYFAQANESRMPVPKLVFATVAQFAGWQPKHYMFLGWALVCGIFFMMWRLCYRLPSRKRPLDAGSLWALSVTAALLFTPAAFENWLWGIQWVIFVPLLCALMMLPLQMRSRSFAVRYGVTVLVNAGAMLTFSNGMVLWAVSFPFWRESLLLLAGNQRRRARKWRLLGWAAAYFLTAFIAVRAYFSGYEGMGRESPGAYAVAHPWEVLKYFFAWCGRPFDAGLSTRMAMGVVMVLALLLLAGFLVRLACRQRGWRAVRQIRILYPALIIIAYACASGVMTAVGRASQGVGQTIAYRYLFHSGTLAIGMLAVLNMRRLWARAAGGQMPLLTAGFAAAVGVTGYFTVRGWSHGLRRFDETRLERTQSALTLRLMDIVPKSPLTVKVCHWNDPRPIYMRLRERGIYSLPDLGDWLIEAANHPSQESGGKALIRADVPASVTSAAGFIIEGWAELPGRDAPADSVLVCKKGADGRREPWLLLAVGHKNTDAVSATGRRSLLRSGFREAVPWEAGSPPELEFFAVDEASRRLFPLGRSR